MSGKSAFFYPNKAGGEPALAVQHPAPPPLLVCCVYYFDDVSSFEAQLLVVHGDMVPQSLCAHAAITDQLLRNTRWRKNWMMKYYKHLQHVCGWKFQQPLLKVSFERFHTLKILHSIVSLFNTHWTRTQFALRLGNILNIRNIYWMWICWCYENMLRILKHC